MCQWLDAHQPWTLIVLNNLVDGLFHTNAYVQGIFCWSILLIWDDFALKILPLTAKPKNHFQENNHLVSPPSPLSPHRHGDCKRTPGIFLKCCLWKEKAAHSCLFPSWRQILRQAVTLLPPRAPISSAAAVTLTPKRSLRGTPTLKHCLADSLP